MSIKKKIIIAVVIGFVLGRFSTQIEFSPKIIEFKTAQENVEQQTQQKSSQGDTLGVATDIAEDEDASPEETLTPNANEEDIQAIALYVERVFACDKEDEYSDDFTASMIAGMVINRVKSSDFPNTVSEVLEELNETEGLGTASAPSQEALEGVKYAFETDRQRVSENTYWLVPYDTWNDESNDISKYRLEYDFGDFCLLNTDTYE